MRLARFVRSALRHAAWLAGAVAAVVAPAWAAEAVKCDYSGFEKPCQAGGGDYRALVPEGEGPFPAMIYLYGSGGRSVTIANHPLFEAAVTGRGYALIVPAALEMTYVGGVRDTGWRLRHEPTPPGEPGRDEVAFLSAVIEDATRRFDLDRGRVLIVGQSRGGFLALEIACHEPGLAAAYAIHGAGYLGPLPARCEAPVRLLHTHGRADPMVPIGGRPLPGPVTGIPPMDDTLRLVARTNGCKAEPGEPEEWLDFQRQGWSGCAPGSRLDLLLHEGDHTMPASWFRAVLDWFKEPLPQAPDASAAVVRRIGEGLPTAARDTTDTLAPDARPAGRFKAPPPPGQKALGSD